MQQIVIREIATLEITAGKEAEFEAAVAKAAPLFRNSKGCHGMALERSVETPTRYFLRIDWATIEDHMTGFRESAAFGEWRALVTPYFGNAPRSEGRRVGKRYVQRSKIRGWG